LQHRLDTRIGGFFVFGEEKTFEGFDWLTVDEVLRRVQVEVNDFLQDMRAAEERNENPGNRFDGTGGNGAGEAAGERGSNGVPADAAAE
jgi:hypothetical protein